MHITNKIRSTKLALLLKLVALVLLILFVVNAKRLSFPGFEGYVFDKVSGKPIENAYVVSSTKYYSCCDAFNLGGGNLRPDSIQIAKTDKNGFFQMKPHIRFVGGWTESRSVIFFKDGYLYPQAYAQCANRKSMLSNSCEPYEMSVDDIPFSYIHLSLETPIHVYLSNEPDPNKSDRFGSKYQALLYTARTYHSHYKYDRNREFKKLKPFFNEVYQLLSKNSDEIIRTFPEPYYIHNWQNDLQWYRDELRSDDPIPHVQKAFPEKATEPLHVK